MSAPLEEQSQARAFKRLVREAGGLESAQEETGKSKTQLHRYTDPADPASAPIAIVEALEAITHDRTGHPIVTRHLATKAGFSLVKVPRVPATGGDLLTLVAAQARESATITGSVIQAIEDHEIDGDECDEIIGKIDRALELLALMRAEVAFVREGKS